MRVVLLTSALLMAACAPTPPVAGAPMDNPGDLAGDCGAEKFQRLIGQSRAMLDEAALPKPHRIIAHDAMVTMDYAPTRLNIQLDQDGRVARVFCG